MAAKQKHLTNEITLHHKADDTSSSAMFRLGCHRQAKGATPDDIVSKGSGRLVGIGPQPPRRSPYARMAPAGAKKKKQSATSKFQCFQCFQSPSPRHSEIQKFQGQGPKAEKFRQADRRAYPPDNHKHSQTKKKTQTSTLFFFCPPPPKSIRCWLRVDRGGSPSGRGPLPGGVPKTGGKNVLRYCGTWPLHEAVIVTGFIYRQKHPAINFLMIHCKKT